MWAFSDYRLDERKRILQGASGVVRLEPRVMELLLYLVRNRDRAVSRAELLERVWSGVSLERSAVCSAVKKLRRSLGSAREAIATVRGYGFRFAASVVELPAAEEPARTAAALRGGSAEADCALPTITALPFRTLEESDRELGLLLAEDLLLRLHEYGILPVIAPDPARWLAAAEHAGEAASRPRYVIRGTLWRVRRQAVASVCLIDAQHSQLVWSLRTSTSESDAGAAIDALSAQIAAALWSGFEFGGAVAPAATAPRSAAGSARRS
jgi:DNA-binding winged helix-turn-helix (wHTH) protein